MERKTKALYLIIGPSGVGKTTLAETLKETEGLGTVHSYTTRPPRYDGETGHIFLTEEEFDNLGELVAYTEFNGYRYGITKEVLDKASTYVIDIDGAKLLEERYKDRKIIKIGLVLNDASLAKRVRARGDSEEEITSRLKHDKEAFKDLESFCDIIVDANVPAETLAQFVAIDISLKELRASAERVLTLRPEAAEEILAQLHKLMKGGTNEVL